MVNVDLRDLWEHDNIEGHSEVDIAKDVPKVVRLSVDLGI
jgi:hypothetical protein